MLRGKSWAYMGVAHRASKRKKDLADITRLVETRPELRESLPLEVQRALPV
ncbi:MAG: hypothetical protein HUU46_16985 [Candidatus Hydrogenedentes bacterium]|nr:hypothetical protein [Candidatus Hydrogenedentota bacterium]